MSLRQLVQIKRDPPNLLGTSHQPQPATKTKKERRSWPPPTQPYPSFHFQSRISSAMSSSVGILHSPASNTTASNIIFLQGSITHNISHHLVKCCNFLHDIMSVIEWCHQLGTFFDKIVSTSVQCQGYLDPDIIGLFCHDYIICTT